MYINIPLSNIPFDWTPQKADYGWCDGSRGGDYPEGASSCMTYVASTWWTLSLNIPKYMNTLYINHQQELQSLSGTYSRLTVSETKAFRHVTHSNAQYPGKILSIEVNDQNSNQQNKYEKSINVMPFTDYGTFSFILSCDVMTLNAENRDGICIRRRSGGGA